MGDPDGHDGVLDTVSNVLNGALNAWGSDNLAGAGRVDGGNLAYRVGQVVGDAGALIQGTFETGIGAGGEVVGVGKDDA